MTKLAQNRQTWNSLNNPDLSITEADITVLGLPFDEAASFRKGAAQGPDRIREISQHIAPTTELGSSLKKLKVLDLGNLDPAAEGQSEYFKQIEAKAETLFRQTFPTFLGGDHSVSIPLISAAANLWGDQLGVIHLDAHLDLCDEIDGNRLSHGCTHRRILERYNLPLKNLYFIGIRSFEDQELNFLREKEGHIITASDLEDRGVSEVATQVRHGLRSCRAVYLTVDIDFLDPAFAPGTGTPKPGGPKTRTALTLLRNLAGLPLIGMDLVEVAPPLDHNDITSFAAQRIITESWGIFLAGS